MDKRIPRVGSLCRVRLFALCCVFLCLVPGIEALGQIARFLDLNREGTASVILAEDTKTAFILDGGTHTSSGQALMIDGVPLLQYLHSHGYRNIVILCSHPHSDHMGGLLDIIRHKKSQPTDVDLGDFSKVVLVDSGHPPPTSLKTAFDRAHESFPTDRVHYVSADAKDAFDDPVLQEFFGPGKNVQVSNFVYKAKPGAGIHGRSIVTHILLKSPDSNETTLLIDYDDADNDVIHEWADRAPATLPKATHVVVVTSHHGSDHTNIAPLLDLHRQGILKVDSLVVTASGRRAISFGHPGPQNLLRWGTILGGVNGIHVTGGVGTITVTETGVSPLDIAGRKNTLERVILPLASRHEAKVQQLTERALVPADRFPPARLEDEVRRCGLSLAMFADRLSVKSDVLTSWVEGDGAESELSGRIYEEVRAIKTEKKKTIHDSNAHALAVLSLALTNDGTLPPPPDSMEGPATDSPPPSPNRPSGSPSGRLALARILGPSAFNGDSERATYSGGDWPEDPPMSGVTQIGGPRGPRMPPSAPGEGSHRFKVLSDDFQKGFKTRAQDRTTGVSERAQRFDFSRSGRPIFGGLIVGNHVSGPTVNLLKAEIILVPEADAMDGVVRDEFSEGPLVEIGILVDGGDGRRWYFADALTQTELWTAYHFVRPLSEWREHYGVSDHECNLVGAQRDANDDGQDGWTFGIHPAIEHTALARDCMMLDMLIAHLLNADPPADHDLKRLLAPIRGHYTTYQWYDVASRVILDGERVDVVPAEPTRASLLGMRVWGYDNARHIGDDLKKRVTAINARASQLDARATTLKARLNELNRKGTVRAVSEQEALVFQNDFETFKSDKEAHDEERKAIEEAIAASNARGGALELDDARFCEECVLRLPPARRFERFVRTVALLHWIEETNQSAFPLLPDGIVCIQGDVPAKLSYRSLSEVLQQTVFNGPLYVANIAAGPPHVADIAGGSKYVPNTAASRWPLAYVSGVIAIAVTGCAIWMYRRRILVRSNAVSRFDPAADPNAIVIEVVKVVVGCPECGQRMRLPCQLGTLEVTCPTCKHRWDYVPS